MGLIAKDLPALIFLLLPGFISAGVFYTLTAHPKTSEFERLIQSLIFTAFVRVAVSVTRSLIYLVGLRCRSFGTWDADVEFNWSILLAVLIGIVFAFLANHDTFHWVARKCKLSNRTSYPSEWYGTFKENPRRVVLHMDGDRRLKGWPAEWPDQPDKGHFVITDPAWILDDERLAPVYEDDRIMIPAVDVKIVEFLRRPEEITEDPEEVLRSRELLNEARKRAEEKGNGSEGPAGSP